MEVFFVPQELKIGPYSVYFWSTEADPLEPIHVHISEGRAVPNATKVWITSKGKTLLCNNASQIPDRILSKLLKVIEANSDKIINDWLSHFGEIRFYC